MRDGFGPFLRREAQGILTKINLYPDVKWLAVDGHQAHMGAAPAHCRRPCCQLPNVPSSPIQPQKTTGFARPRLEASKLRRLGIDTGYERVVYLDPDSPICRSEGFGPHSRLSLRVGEREVLATLNLAHSGSLAADEAGLSESAWQSLQPKPGEKVVIAHPPNVDSMAYVRAKVFDKEL
ncbi:MAG TPA: hypothetical protein VMA74_11150, partial [Dyella sp.]|nr:hypothetical protein [Dyella sp.]